MVNFWGGLGAVVFLALVIAMALATKRKQWNNDGMVAAMKAVENEELPISAAASKFKVPRKTLDDRIKGRVQHGTAPGPSTVLTAEGGGGCPSVIPHLHGTAWVPTYTYNNKGIRLGYH